MIRAILLAFTFLFTVNANAQYNYGYQQQQPTYGYQQQQPTYGYQQQPTYRYQQQSTYGYQQQPTYGYQQQSTYGYQQQPDKYGYGGYDINRNCIIGTRGCPLSRASQRYWEKEQLTQQMEDKAWDEYFLRKQQEFYQNQSSLVKFTLCGGELPPC